MKQCGQEAILRTVHQHKKFIEDFHEKTVFLKTVAC